MFDQVLSLVADGSSTPVDNAALYEKAARWSRRGAQRSILGAPDPEAAPTLSTTRRVATVGSGCGSRIRMASSRGSGIPETRREAAGIQEGDRMCRWTRRPPVVVDGTGTNSLTARRHASVRAVRAAWRPRSNSIGLRERRHNPSRPIACSSRTRSGTSRSSRSTRARVRSGETSVDQMLKGGANGVIIDFVGNPGGILDQGLAVDNIFLDGGNEIASVRGRGMIRSSSSPRASPRWENATRRSGRWIHGSASEIVAGACRTTTARSSSERRRLGRDSSRRCSRSRAASTQAHDREGVHAGGSVHSEGPQGETQPARVGVRGPGDTTAAARVNPPARGRTFRGLARDRRREEDASDSLADGRIVYGGGGHSPTSLCRLTR